MVLVIPIAPLLLLVGAGWQEPGRPEETTRPLVELPRERVEIRAWMKRHGWKSKRNSPKRFEVGEGRLRLVSRDDSVLIGTQEGLPLDPEDWPRLRFRLRVDEVPTETDLARKSGDDAAFRIYVAFDEGGGWFRPPNTLAYIWTEGPRPRRLHAEVRQQRHGHVRVGLAGGPGARRRSLSVRVSCPGRPGTGSTSVSDEPGKDTVGQRCAVRPPTPLRRPSPERRAPRDDT